MVIIILTMTMIMSTLMIMKVFYHGSDNMAGYIIGSIHTSM